MKNKKRTSTPIRAIIIVILCTILTSAGQILLKIASKNIDSFYVVITNIPLIIGCILYGAGAILLIIALKYGELSVLYPFIALSFVWVTISSIFIFNEHVTIMNWLGIVSILVGVSLIGRGS
jgi:multidrug transporter EmrE-like cation transporter